MARIFLIRHGEPTGAWGIVEDPGLSAKGRVQAEAAAAVLVKAGPLRLLSSPLLRCRETAEPTARLLAQDVGIEPKVGEVRTPEGIADRRAWLAGVMAPGVIWATLAPETRAWREGVVRTVQSWRDDVAVFTHFVAINAIVSHATARAETIVCHPNFASVTELALDDDGLRLVKLGAQMQTEVR